jgi:hypothetical protein
MQFSGGTGHSFRNRSHENSSQKTSCDSRGHCWTLYTASRIARRAVLMGLVNYTFLLFPTPVGYGYVQEVVIAPLSLVIIFNLTLELCIIPIGYSLARIVESNLKTLKLAKSALCLNAQ